MATLPRAREKSRKRSGRRSAPLRDTPEILLALYRTMLTIRRFELTAAEIYAAKKMPGFIHLSVGQEASAVGLCSVLRRDDYVATTHRGHGHVIAKGGDIRRMFAELMGRRTGYCKGKGGSMHIADFSLGILGANGVVAGGLPLTVGAGLSITLRKTDQVAVAFFGDGAANRGPVHEAMNMASIWKLPILFACENNQYASTTPAAYGSSVMDLASRAQGYGMPGVVLDGKDVLAVREAAGEAVARARRGDGPTFLEHKTCRFRGHYEGDPQHYRDRSEVQRWEETRDPINRFASLLTKRGVLTDAVARAIRDAVEQEIQAAVVFGQESEWPDPAEAEEDLFASA